MKVRFLLDENLSPKLKLAVKRQNSAIDILRVGEKDSPFFRTLDPEILQYLQLSKRLLITDNRSSIPEHLNNHWKQGGHIYGVVWVRPNSSIYQLVESLILIWKIT